MLLAESFTQPTFSWNLIATFSELTSYAYMRHAYAAGAIVAILGAVVGWYAILRSETYATHTLSLVGFPGAAGAALLGIPPLAGFFAFCVSGAFIIPALTGRGRATNQSESAAVGSVQALALAFGLLFISLYGGFLSSVNTFLFGTFTGITFDEVLIMAAVGVVTLGLINVIHKRLVFASIDPHTAQASGIRVRAMEILFLVILGIAVAEASQFTGALLAFTLTITPAAIAQTLTPRPRFAMAIAMAFGIAFAWGGLSVAYFTSYPVGFFVTTFAFVTYAFVRLVLKR